MKKQILLSLAISMFITAFSQVNFQTHTIGDYGLGYMEDVYSADLDGDGDMDVILGHEDNVSWFENLDGLGTFGELQTVTSNFINTQSVYSVDIDGDNDMDIISASAYDGIAWFQNDGSGNFSDKIIISTYTYTSYAMAVYAADLDGDNDFDVISASLDDNKIAWYANDGDGVFGAQQIISNIAGGAEDVYACDIDNDGDMDVLSASYYDDKIAWYPNDGTGNFDAQNIIGIVDGVQSVFAEDMDNDGDMDVLSAASDDNKIVWYENTDGLGNFGSEQIIYNVAGGGYSVCAADLDGDEDADVIYSTSSRIAWQENIDGQGTFGEQNIVVDFTAGVCYISTADINNDGRMDILATYPAYPESLVWFENQGSVSINQNQSAVFSVHPNPTKGVLNIDSETPVSKIEIFDQAGKLLLERKETRAIVITTLEEGFYIAKITDKNGKNKIVKIVKQ